MEIYFKEGDKVKSPIFGEGVVTLIDTFGVYPVYPVRVQFNSSEHGFTLEGRYLKETEIMLFQEHVTLPQMPKNTPLLQFSNGEIVWAKIQDEWRALRFAKQDSRGHTYVYAHQSWEEEDSMIQVKEVSKFEKRPF